MTSAARRAPAPPPEPGAAGFAEARRQLARARTDPHYLECFTKRRPLVSVCVATCNRPGLLVERCLASLLRQTYRHLDIVVVGDGCTDDTAAHVATLADPRIRFENLPTRGPYPRPGWNRWRVAGTNAMNHGLALADGDFIAHLDDDDQADEERIEALVEAILTARVDLVSHPFFAQFADGVWRRLGNGRLQLGQVTTGSTLYHRYFARYGWDVHAYRTAEPGDWQRLRRLQALGLTYQAIDRPLLFHFKERNQPTFELLAGETFIDEAAPAREIWP